MKKTHIIAIVLIAVAIGTILSTFLDSSTYASFAEAIETPGKEFHVAGTLNLKKEMVYNPEQNANLFSFYLLDREGNEAHVLFNGTKPQDFERYESVVITGKMKGENFIADKILMKCPSKYNDGQEGLKEYKAAEPLQTTAL